MADISEVAELAAAWIPTSLLDAVEDLVAAAERDENVGDLERLLDDLLVLLWEATGGFDAA